MPASARAHRSQTMKEGVLRMNSWTWVWLELFLTLDGHRGLDGLYAADGRDDQAPDHAASCGNFEDAKQPGAEDCADLHSQELPNLFKRRQAAISISRLDSAIVSSCE